MARNTLANIASYFANRNNIAPNKVVIVENTSPLQTSLAAAASADQLNIPSQIDTTHTQLPQNSDAVTDSLADGLPFDPKDFDALFNGDELP